MRILYFSPHPHLNLSSPSGYGTHMREIIGAFRQQDHEVKTFIVGGEQNTKNNTSAESHAKGTLKKIIPKIIWESLKDYRLIRLNKSTERRLAGEIKEYQPDLIYERGFYLMPGGASIAKQFGIKHILEINAPYMEERIALQGNTLFKNKAEQAEKKQISDTGKLVVVSTALKEHFQKKHQLPEEKIIVTPNAVNLDKINVDPKVIETLKKQFGLADKTVIGFVGSIFPYHGVDLLIEAFTQIKKQTTTQLKLIIIGDGETLSDLKKQAETAGLTNEIIFTGNVKHSTIFNYIALFDIAVMAKSNWYGSPVKIFEYGAMQKAIIAPNNIPVKDVMVNNADGLLVEGSLKSLAEALLKYIDHPELRQQYANSFYQKVQQEHTWYKMAKKILSTCI